MDSSATINALAAALAKAQQALEGAEKDAVNPHFKSKYATLASVWEAWRKVGPEHGLAVAQGVTADGPAVTVFTRLLHSSGEWLESGLTLVAKDASPQSIVAACTYGRRAGLAAMVGVSPEDDDAESIQPRQPHTTGTRTIAEPDLGSRVAEATTAGGVLVESVSEKDKYGCTHIQFTDGVSLKTKKGQVINEAKSYLEDRTPVRYSRWEKNERWVGDLVPVMDEATPAPAVTDVAPLTDDDIPF